MDIETLLKNPDKIKELLAQNDSIIRRYESEIKTKDSIIEEQKKSFTHKDLEITKYLQKIEEQKNIIQTLRQTIFARKSEKVIRESPKQNLLFNEIETYVDTEDKGVTEIRQHKRKNAGRKPIPDNVPREIITNDLSEEDKTCSCGCKLNKIGEDIKEDLEYTPAKIEVKRTITPKYVCRSCSKKKANVEIKKAPPITRPLIERSIVTPSLIAAIIYQKFFLALPFYRQSKMFLHLGYNISRTDMCNWANTIYEKYLKDFQNLFWDEILKHPNIHIDETTLKVLKQKDKDRKVSYMWAIATNNAVLYNFQETREARFLKEKLINFKGSVVTDGYSGYEALFESLPDIIHAGCMSHARRKLLENRIALKGSNTGKELLFHIRKLYRVEAWAKKLQLSDDKKLKLRNKWSRIHVARIRSIIDINLPNVSSGTYISNVITYMNNQWSKLTKFLDNPQIPIDNNYIENLIRPFVVGRKNWLFSSSETGANASAMYYSLLVSATLNGLNPIEYLKSIFEKLPYATSIEHKKNLLPWNFNRA
jgi:transposase